MRSRFAVLLGLLIAGCDADPCATALELTPVGGRISARFTVDHVEPGAGWKLVVVHEGHVAWRGNGRPGPFWLDDYVGADRVSIRATGPDGRICTAEQTLAARD